MLIWCCANAWKTLNYKVFPWWWPTLKALLLFLIYIGIAGLTFSRSSFVGTHRTAKREKLSEGKYRGKNKLLYWSQRTILFWPFLREGLLTFFAHQTSITNGFSSILKLASVSKLVSNKINGWNDIKHMTDTLHFMYMNINFLTYI